MYTKKDRERLIEKFTNNDETEMWRDLNGTTTAPLGYKWQSNGKSFFSGERKIRLVPEN